MPVDRGAIDVQLREIGEGERWWEQREFRDLPHVLHAGERILGIVNGKLLGPRRPRIKPGGTWLLVATDQRLICLQQERFARKQIEFAAGQITRIDQSSRLRSYQVTIETPQRKCRIRIPKAEAFRFVGALAPLIPQPGVPRIHPDLEPLSWIPGMTTIAALPGIAGIVSKVSLLSPPDYSDRGQIERMEAAIERMQEDVERLQQQVAFLEELLEKRGREAMPPRLPAEAQTGAQS